MSNVKKTILFFTGLAFIHVGLIWLAFTAGDVYKQGVHMVVENKRDWARSPNKFDPSKKSVVFLGNSILLAGIMPSVFDESLSGKTDTYNFALPALPIGSALHVLESLVKNWGKPDYIVVRVVTDHSNETGLFDTNGVQGIRPMEFLSYLVHRPNKAFALNYAFPLRMNVQNTVTFLLNLVRDPADIASTRARNKQILAKLREDRGWYYIRQQAYFPDGRLPDGFALRKPEELTPIDPGPFEWSTDPYLRKFLDYTAANGIKVLLIGSIYREGSEAPFSRIPGFFVETPKQYPHVRVTSKSWETKFLPNRYFSDKTHVNAEGAQIYTRMIADDFKEAFGDEL